MPSVLPQSRHLFTRELRDPEVSVACAKVMAHFHQLTMPLIKEPRWLFDIMSTYVPESYISHLAGIQGAAKKYYTTENAISQ